MFSARTLSMRSLSRRSLQSTSTIADSFKKLPRAGFAAMIILFGVQMPLFTWLFTLCEDWGSWEAYLFVAAIVSTVGYGNIYPVTDEGKLLVIVGGLTGIPLVLASLDFLSEFLIWSIETCLKLVRQKLHGHQQIPPRVLTLTCVVFTMIYLMQAIAIYHYMEPDWTWLDSAYFVFCLTSTVGLGDFVPTSTSSYNEIPPFTWYHVWHICSASCGLAIIAVFLSLAQASVHHRLTLAAKTASASTVTAKLYSRITHSKDTKMISDPIWATILEAFEAAASSSSVDRVIELIMDKDGSGQLLEAEFIDACRTVLYLPPDRVPDKKLRWAFQALDIDHSGSLELVELMMFLNVHREFSAQMSLEENQENSCDIVKENSERGTVYI